MIQIPRKNPSKWSKLHILESNLIRKETGHQLYLDLDKEH